MHIKKNITQLKEWLFTDGQSPIQLRIVEPADINPVKHYHRAMHEYFYLVQGSVDIDVDGTIHSLEKDDLLVAEPGEIHVITRMSPDMKLLLLMPPPIPGDKVVVSE